MCIREIPKEVVSCRLSILVDISGVSQDGKEQNICSVERLSVPLIPEFLVTSTKTPTPGLITKKYQPSENKVPVL